MSCLSTFHHQLDSSFAAYFSMLPPISHACTMTVLWRPCTRAGMVPSSLMNLSLTDSGGSDISYEDLEIVRKNAATVILEFYPVFDPQILFFGMSISLC